MELGVKTPVDETKGSPDQVPPAGVPVKFKAGAFKQTPTSNPAFAGTGSVTFKTTTSDPIHEF